MNAEPQAEHRWLERLVGEWIYESEMPAHEGKPSEKMTGTETVRSLGGVWIIGEARGPMPGAGLATMVVTLGYDTRKRRFVGSWVGSMMTNLWVYNGGLDNAGNVLTLDTEGPHMSVEGKLGKYQDVIELKSDDERVLTSRFLDDDGQWRQIMSMRFRRTK
ncbi:MAG: DUF1579 domain-containing protein [Betaproteobacteria bacterium]